MSGPQGNGHGATRILVHSRATTSTGNTFDVASSRYRERPNRLGPGLSEHPDPDHRERPVPVMDLPPQLPTETAHYLTWGWASISVPNLIVVVVTLTLFVLAIALPFPKPFPRPFPEPSPEDQGDVRGNS